MPARSRKTLQQRPRGGLFVQMHRLGIEFGGKGKHLLTRDSAWAECAEMAGREIFEGQHDLGIAAREARLWPLFAAISTPQLACSRRVASIAVSVLAADLAWGARWGLGPVPRPLVLVRLRFELRRGNDKCLNFGICFSGTASSRPRSSRHFTGW